MVGIRRWAKNIQKAITESLMQLCATAAAPLILGSQHTPLRSVHVEPPDIQTPRLFEIPDNFFD